MKISLNWIFDHIKGEISQVNIEQFVDTFIKTTAEIEGWKKVTLDTNTLTLVHVRTVTSTGVTVYSPEHKKEYQLSMRNEFVSFDELRTNGIGTSPNRDWYLIFCGGNHVAWATSVMMGGEKEMLLPALHVAQELQAGGWKSAVELHDYIIDIDNKSINNRPDLWGHRGLARECAAMFNMPLRPLQEFIVTKEVNAYDQQSQPHNNNPFSLGIEIPELCGKFSALYMPSVTAQPSHLSMMIRLSRLDSRSINFLVDATNYVMLDLGHPMHAFDADTFVSKKITVQCARDKEKLLLLDGQTVELTSQDIVIADDGNAVSLAGVMGGAATSVTAQTKALFIEAAQFDAATIRRTAHHHKKRTESVVRFTKNLDPQQTTHALLRFLFLLDAAGIAYQADDAIVALGKSLPHTVIKVEHMFIEARLGIIIKPERVVTLLEKIDFEVVQSVENNILMYIITVPSFRAAKDVKIAEDIVEEVGRFIGYDALPRVMPAMQLRPSDLHATHTTRAIKHFLSYGLMMHELYGYAFFDESVLREINWQKPGNAVAIKNPISENYTHLVTTLQPHLLKSVAENSIHHTQLRFYEWGRVWSMLNDEIVECKVVSGIFVEPNFDFYAGKLLITRLFDMLDMQVNWQQDEQNKFPWYAPYQIASIMHDGQRIGHAGMTNDGAFMFEIDADYLLAYKKPATQFVPIAKYPSVLRDVSILILMSMNAEILIDVIKSVDKRIESVTLIDFFVKPEWKDRKAMTFHITIGDKDKTLITQQVEEIYNNVVAQLQQAGAVIR
jgi:phenylalanyl-tRNA synthetase beta chain